MTMMKQSTTTTTTTTNQPLPSPYYYYHHRTVQRGGDSGEEMERVRESGYGDRIDRKMGSVFGVGRKIPPEKFSGGGAAVVAGKVAGDGGGRNPATAPVVGRSPKKMSGREGV
ncbi:hypothetical protein Tco_0457210 [Tanacetum coccineum]